MSLSKVKTRDYPIEIKKCYNKVKTILTPTYELKNEDNGFILVIDVSTSAVITIPQLSMPVGAQIDFFKTGNSELLFSPAVGITILKEGNKLATNNTAATLIKLADTTYFLVGKLTI